MLKINVQSCMEGTRRKKRGLQLQEREERWERARGEREGAGEHGGEREGGGGTAQHLINTKRKENSKTEKQIEYNTYW